MEGKLQKGAGDAQQAAENANKASLIDTDSPSAL
jgi:hypothetical protein